MGIHCHEYSGDGMITDVVIKDFIDDNVIYRTN